MPLEATMICMDNSEWNRNGDFAPSRWDSQQDAATIICQAKTQQNPESTVGVLSMAGKRVELRLTQTNEVGELFNCIGNIQINGDSDMLTAIKIAQLSLKHRQNKSQRQRIVVFVGHPIRGTEEDFEDVGMRLKKNNVAIDVINFANPDNISRLQALVNTANQGAEEQPNCHFLDVPPGCTNITDVMITSPILQSEDMGGGAAAGGDGAGAGGGPDDPNGGLGFDPNMDPELAAAIRLSLQEANAAQAAQNQPQPAADGGGAGADAGAGGAAGVQPGLQAVAEEDDGMYDDVNEDEPQDDDEKALQEALALSMMPGPESKAAEAKPDQAAKENKDGQGAGATENVDLDADLLKDVIGDLGIDLDEGQLEDIVNEATNKKEGEDKDKKDDKGGDKK